MPAAQLDCPWFSEVDLSLSLSFLQTHACTPWPTFGVRVAWFTVGKFTYTAYDVFVEKWFTAPWWKHSVGSTYAFP